MQGRGKQILTAPYLLVTKQKGVGGIIYHAPGKAAGSVSRRRLPSLFEILFLLKQKKPKKVLPGFQSSLTFLAFLSV